MQLLTTAHSWVILLFNSGNMAFKFHTQPSRDRSYNSKKGSVEMWQKCSKNLKPTMIRYRIEDKSIWNYFECCNLTLYFLIACIFHKNVIKKISLSDLMHKKCTHPLKQYNYLFSYLHHFSLPVQFVPLCEGKWRSSLGNRTWRWGQHQSSPFHGTASRYRWWHW